MRRFAVILSIFLGMLLISCSDPTSSPVPIPLPPDQTVGITDKAFLHLNITEGKIFNTSVNMEYTVTGNWDGTEVYCDGAVQDLNLDVGDHVIVRTIETGDTWERDLGTVAALTGRPDFIPGNALYIGVGNFDDVIYAEPNETLRILSYMYNYGEYHSSANSYIIDFYLSADRIIDSNDTPLGAYNYIWSCPPGEIYVTGGSDLEFQVPTNLIPGTYYIGVIMDSGGAVDELNEENNTTLPEDVATLIIMDPTAPASGAMKIVNSWGTGSWDSGSLGQQKTGDGHYWMPYEVMKANHMGITYYKNDFATVYEPNVIVTIELDHPRRDECKVSIGLGDPNDPFIEKQLESDWGDGNPLGGSHPFPDNIMVVDITEFAYAVNDSNLFLKIENTGGTQGSIDVFSVEYYSDYSSAAIKTVDGWTGAFAGNRVSTAFATTLNALTRGELLSILPPLSASTDGSLTFYEEFPDAAELRQDKLSLGVYTPGVNYNKLYSGKYGTGYKPPTEEYWKHMKKLRAIDTGLLKADFEANTLLEVDNSDTNYFPPIGHQGSEGSCAAFSMGYYIQTYTEAKEHNWDLSTIGWESDLTGLSSGGRPDDHLYWIFSPDFIYHQINGGEDLGSNTNQAAALIIRLGGATWATMPYNTSDSTSWPDEAAWREAPKYRGEKVSNLYWDYDLSGYFTIDTDADIQLLKALLFQGYIVSTAIHVDTIFYGDVLSPQDVIYTDGSATWYGSYSTDHAQTIVGYKEGSKWDSSDPDSEL